ncbi:MAG: hypothetical protein RIC03_12640 [Cyclobacteriaceae bacterium]
MTILQQPSNYQFAGNLPDIIVDTDTAIDFTLSKGGDIATIILAGGSSSWPVDTLITGTTSGATGKVQSFESGTLILYDVDGTFQNGENITSGTIATVSQSQEILIEESYVPDSNNIVKIEIREFFEELFSIAIPRISDASIVQSKAFGNYKIIIESTEFTFYVIKGGGRNLPDFIGSKFHTWQPATKYIKTDDIDFLTFFTKESASVYSLFTYQDNTTDEVKLTDLTAFQLHTVNVSPFIIDNDFKNLKTFEIWVADPADSSARISNSQKFIITDEFFTHEDNFLFENSLGGIESVKFTGDLIRKEQFNKSTGMFGRTLREYETEDEKQWTKNTGLLRSAHEILWCRDFFASEEKYWFKNLQLVGIRTVGTFESKKTILNNYQFDVIENEKDVYQDYFDFFSAGNLLVAPKLTLEPLSDTQINVLFSDPNKGKASSELWIKIGGGAYTLLATLDAGITEYQHTDLTTGLVYRYKLRATIGSRVSLYSDEKLFVLKPWLFAGGNWNSAGAWYDGEQWGV